MYSRRVIERNILRAEKVIKETHSLPLRWTLKPPNAGERDEMREHFNTLLDNKGYLIRDFTNEERLWILVENTFCKIDFLYFARNYAKIQDWSAKVVYFEPNIAQQIFLDLMAEYEENGWALMFMLLKARQLGITTVCQLILAHRDFFYRNVGAYTGSAEEKKSRAMVGKLEFIWEQTPWWLRPRKTASQAGDFIQFGDLNSGLWVQWGNQTQGIGRGATPTIAHLSEVSTFEHPEQLIDAALYRAMHENPFAFLALESTAHGIGDWWWKMWYLMSKMDARGIATYKPIFLPWYVGSDLYPTKWDLRRRPVPTDWQAPEYVENHARAAREYVQSNLLLRRALSNDWQMPIEQKWYYYLEYETAREMRQLHILLQELPASADEAFQNSNPSVFSIETLSATRTESNASIPSGTFQIAGPSIPFVHSDQRAIGDPVDVKALSSEGVIVETFRLDPVERDGWPDADPQRKLYIWEWPLQGEQYGVYCDTSEGVGLDSSVIGVIKKATPWHPDEQVAEWASNMVPLHDLWAFVFCLAHIYTVRGVDGQWQEPLVVIENNLDKGSVQMEMAKRGYGNFYRQLDLMATGEVGPQFNRRPRMIKDRVGWITDRYNRPKMLSLFRKLVRDGNFIVRSPFVVREMGTLEYNIDKQRIQASEDQHDDRVMGPAMLLCAWYDPEVYGTVPTAFIEQRSYEASLERMPTYMGDIEIGRAAKHREFISNKSDSRILSYV